MGTVSAFTILPRIYSITTGLNSHKSCVFANALSGIHIVIEVFLTLSLSKQVQETPEL